MADNENKAPQAAPVERKAFKGYKLGNDKTAIDVTTKHGAIRVTNELLKKDKVVAMLQAQAPHAFQSGLIVLA